MRILEENGNIILEQMPDFDVAQTLECGQCFHFKKLSDNTYGVVAYGRLLHIGSDNGRICLYNTTREEFENIWRRYFDLDTDYGLIKDTLKGNTQELNEAITQMWGVRILRQEFFETLMSFIISQNKQIPHIKQIVAAISKEYGTYLGTLDEEDFYSFPTVQALEGVGEDAYRLLKTGFRASYLADAVNKISSGVIKEEDLLSLDGEGCMERLCAIRGVGRKVASCVTLFSLGKMECFPIDVWIQRIMEYLFFKKPAAKAEIEVFAADRFGPYSGYAQQYLFYYGREIKLGVDKTRSQV